MENGANPDFAAVLKGNHFDYSHTNKKNSEHYVSTNANAYQDHAKGDPTFRGQLNDERKKDLRTNHFDYGNPSLGLLTQSTHNGFFQPPVQSTGGPNIHNSALALKYNAFRMSDEPSKGQRDYITNNMVHYKWV